MLSEAGKHYKEGIIKEYSKRLTNELRKVYSTSNLKRMRQLYLLIEKGAPLAHQLSWSHYQEIIAIKDFEEVLYYINLCINNIITKRELRNRIKSKEYERLDESTRNKLITKEESNVVDFVKNSILIYK